MKPDFLGYGNVTGAAFHSLAADGGVLSIDAGWIGQAPVGLKGLILVESPPIFSSSVTTRVDHTPTPSQRPHRLDRGIETAIKMTATTDIIEATYGPNALPMFYRTAAGGMRWAAAGAAASIFLDAVYTGAFPVLYLGNGASLRLQGTFERPLIMGTNTYLWVNATSGHLYRKTGSVPANDTDGTDLG